MSFLERLRKGFEEGRKTERERKLEEVVKKAALVFAADWLDAKTQGKPTRAIEKCLWEIEEALGEELPPPEVMVARLQHYVTQQARIQGMRN